MQNVYRPHRRYKRRDAGPEDEQTRVRITLLEYGNKGKTILPVHLKSDSAYATKSSDASGNAGKSTVTDEAEIQRNELVCLKLCYHVMIRFIFIGLAILLLQIDIDQLLKGLYVANEVNSIIITIINYLNVSLFFQFFHYYLF